MAYTVDVFFSNQLVKDKQFIHGESDIFNLLYKGKINEDIVIYGSSRATVHFDASMMQDSLHKRVYNLGVIGGKFLIQKLRHDLLMKYNTKPTVILYSLDESTLERQPRIYNSAQLLPFMLFNYNMENSFKSINEFNKLDFYLPLVRYYGNRWAMYRAMIQFCCSTGKEIPERVNGYGPVAAKWNNDLANAKKANKFRRVKIDPELYNQFKHLLISSANNQIKVILIYSPEYIEGQTFISNRKEIMGLYKNLSRELKIPFYDYSNDSLSYQKKYFYNSLHLNSYGAEVFTRHIIKDLKTQL